MNTESPLEPINVEQAYGILLRIGLLAHDCQYSLMSWEHEYKDLGIVPRDLWNNTVIDATATLVRLELSTKDRLSQAKQIFPPPFRNLNLQKALPPPPCSASTALARVSHSATEGDIQRREGHVNYIQGLKQRKVNREIRSAARQERHSQKVTGTQLPTPAEPDARQIGTTASSGDAVCTETDALVSNGSGTLRRSARKRKHRVIISDSEAEDPREDSAEPLSQHTASRGKTPAPHSGTQRNNFVILLSPVRHPSAPHKQRKHQHS